MEQKHLLCSFYELGLVGGITIGKTPGPAQILPLGAGSLQPIGILVLKATFGWVWQGWSVQAYDPLRTLLFKNSHPNGGGVGRG